MSESHWAMVQVLCDLEEGLTAWECDFVDSLASRGERAPLSAKQVEILERIYEQRT